MARGGSKKGERRGGRQKGTPNKLTAENKAEIQDIARLAFSDPDYRQKLQARLNEGRAPHIELFYLQHLYGKPVDVTQIQGVDGGPVETKIINEFHTIATDAHRR
jgi:hypothetical protein